MSQNRSTAVMQRRVEAHARKREADKLYRQVHEDMAARHGIVIRWARPL